MESFIFHTLFDHMKFCLREKKASDRKNILILSSVKGNTENQWADTNDWHFRVGWKPVPKS